jgi:hypothetical protein
MYARTAFSAARHIAQVRSLPFIEATPDDAYLSLVAALAVPVDRLAALGPDPNAHFD